MYEDPMPDDQMVERLHGLLSNALQQNRPRPFDSPVTVAEIYQDLVPYRAVRTALGFQMNADYEHTLLRLLAGEHELARLEPAEARDELRSELDTPNPNVGLFRKFAACDVWVTPGAPIEVHAPVEVAAPAEVAAPLEVAAPAEIRAPVDANPPPAAPAPEPAPGEADAAAWSAEPEVDPRTWSVEAEAEQQGAEEWGASLPELILEEEVPAPQAADVITPAPVPAPAEPSHHTEATTMLEAAASPAATTQTGSCAFCASDLPAGRSVKFCPYCGQDQSFSPCVSCAEPLEPGWTFCIACGSRQDAA